MPLGTYFQSESKGLSNLLYAGIKSPLEDPSEPSYTLGHAPIPQHDDDNDVDVTALSNRLELARGAGQRYLNMHWGDGTVCDKTGRKREIEVQVMPSSFSQASVSPS